MCNLIYLLTTTPENNDNYIDDDVSRRAERSIFDGEENHNNDMDDINKNNGNNKDNDINYHKNKFNKEYDSNVFLSLLLSFLKQQTDVEKNTLSNKVKKFVEVNFVLEDNNNLSDDEDDNNNDNNNNDHNKGGNIKNKRRHHDEETENEKLETEEVITFLKI